MTCRQQHHSAGMPELERGERVAVDDGLLDRSLAWQMAVDHAGEAAVKATQTGREIVGGIGMDSAAGDKPQPIVLGLDDAPAGVAKAWIETQDEHRRAQPASLAQGRLGDLEVGDDPLHVVIVVQRLEQLEQGSALSSSSGDA